MAPLFVYTRYILPRSLDISFPLHNSKFFPKGLYKEIYTLLEIFAPKLSVIIILTALLRNFFFKLALLMEDPVFDDQLFFAHRTI